MPAEIKSKSNELIPPNIRVMILPVFYITILVVVFMVSFRTGYDQITKQRRDIKAAQILEKTLQEKESELKQYVGKLDKYIMPISIALPDYNPALLVINNFKNITEGKPIAFENLQISGGASVTSQTTQAILGVNYEIVGLFDDTLSFLNDVKRMSPIINFSTIELKMSNDISTIEITSSAYYSPYPEKLPPVSEPIEKISDKDIEKLDEILTFRTPNFFEMKVQSPGDRIDPFNL